MTDKEFFKEYNMEDGTLALIDWDLFKSGIIGITEDRCHIVYSYLKLAETLAENYFKDYKEGKYPVKFPENLSDDEIYLECYRDAIDWIEVNTIRSLDYEDPEHRPIIIMDIDSSEL